MIKEIDLELEAKRIAQVIFQDETNNSFIVIDRELRKLRGTFGEIPGGLLFNMVASSLKELARQ